MTRIDQRTSPPPQPVRVSDDAGNIIQERDDGLYAPTPAAARSVEAANAGISVSTDSDSYNVGARVSPNAGNALTITGNGLFVPTAEPGTMSTVSSGSPGISVDADDTDYAVSVVISPDAGNQLEERVNGLYVPPGEGGEPVRLLEIGSITNIVESPDGTFTPVYVRETMVVPADTQYVQLQGSLPTDDGTFYETYLVRDDMEGSGWAVTWGLGEYVNGVEGPGSIGVGGGGSMHIITSEDGEWQVLAADKCEPVYQASGSGDTVLTNVHHNRIVDMASSGTLEVQTQANARYLAEFECTIVRDSGFTVEFPSGVSVNGTSGPVSYSVQRTPGGIVLKRRSENTWFLLGDATIVM